MDNGDFFPPITSRGNLATAGSYAVRLIDGGFVTRPEDFLCPASEQARDAAGYRVPTVREVELAAGEQLAELQRTMGGSFGYNLGYMAGDAYQTVRNRRRPNFAILADTPSLTLPNRQSENHGGCGQNVLYEDGHVEFLTSCTSAGCRDNIYQNDEGYMAAGSHANDAVLGHSAARPLFRFVSQ